MDWGNAGADQRVKTWANRCLIGLFFGLIGLPLVGYWAGRESRRASSENRHLNRRPHLRLSLSSVQAFPAAFEQHYNDHFGFRTDLIHWYGRTKVFGLGDATHSQVVLGRDGWLFYAWGPDGKYARFPHPFAPGELDAWGRVLEARRQWLQQRHCRYLFTLAPEKQSVHVQYLPDLLKHWAQDQGRYDQFKDFLREHTGVTFLDLREPLRQAAARERVYIRTDAHWNDLGAYYAYVRIMRELAAQDPRLQPLPRSAFKEDVVEIRGGDMAVLLGVGGAVRDQDHHFTVINPRAKGIAAEVPFVKSYCMSDWGPRVFEHADPTLPRAVLSGDSFCWRLIPLLAEHFSRLVYLPETVLDQKAIAAIQPDVVICEMAERHLDFLQPKDPLVSGP